MRALSACALLVCLSACERSASPADSSGAAASTSAPSASAAPSPAPAKAAAASLHTLLRVFGGQRPAIWSAFDNMSGVHWDDPKPLDNPDTVSRDATHYRGGNMLLAGFDEVDVPDGKVGSEAGIKKDNEGHVGVVLNGNDSTVLSIVLEKFYQTDDTQSILQRQFGSDATIKLIAGSCTVDYITKARNLQKNAFYQINLPSTAIPLYAETFVDDRGPLSPGVTIFEFTRARPEGRITDMQCRTS
ncbi:hypothetical protein [Ralstonia sp. UBA689]|uniref:hypothetical protein n=1 Tax=Ralstonia sp. UBA689 TaxID=1947373 RepID=UPI0025F10402|nr:hypothetical protein [Ralstonia sp. UBA689]